jgi:hypothetical protein
MNFPGAERLWIAGSLSLVASQSDSDRVAEEGL